MKKQLLQIGGCAGGLFLLPLITLAQTTFFTILGAILVAINRLVPLVMTLAIFVFLWGLAKYIFQTDTVEGKESARNIMVWGIIAIFVMVSLWGLVNLLEVLTGVNTGAAPTFPQIGP